MKQIKLFYSILIIFIIINIGCHEMDNTNFKSEKVSKTATIILNNNISTVFPLFGAFEEKKWAE